MFTGTQSWAFSTSPVLLSGSAVGGPMEAQGPLASSFDLLFDDLWMEQTSYENAQQRLMEEASALAIQKAHIFDEQVDFFISGDLINQMTPTNFAASTLQIPFLGTFNACATSMESVALAAAIIEASGANYILTGSSSHFSSAERQYRFPNEYGSQKPGTSQTTVTGAGCAMISKEGSGPIIKRATIGKIIDLGITDPFNMGAAMAPAAADTIITHLHDFQLPITYYDAVVTGDLGKVGRDICIQLLNDVKVSIAPNQFLDAGLMVYGPDQQVFAGGSGSACSAVVSFGHMLEQLQAKKVNRVLFVATGVLHSPLSIQQQKTMPAIAHAVAIENGSDE
ncbi:MAG TPA: stage V sporulation protein AD [Bacillota bacterium]|nr:stage V sporulation protein AD [Bacillota bacterium]